MGHEGTEGHDALCAQSEASGLKFQSLKTNQNRMIENSKRFISPS